jgi:hypothetical protein
MTYFRAALRSLSVFLSAGAIAFCSKSSPTEPVVLQDSVTIVSIQPPAGAILQVGAPVSFTVTVAFTLASAPSGSVVMVVEDDAFRTIPGSLPQPTIGISRGRGMVTLTQQILVPPADVASVDVFFALAATGGTQSLAVQEVTYHVGPAASGLVRATLVK